MTIEQFDITIIGGGPGGYVAAIRASQLGLKVALVEKEHLGGICLNWGCIPTKALLRSAELYHQMQHADQFGLSAKEVGFDFQKIVTRSRDVSSQLTKGVAHLMKKHKVTVFDGYGKLNGKQRVCVRKGPERTDEKIADITSPHIVLATGARARVLPGLEPDGKQIWTYKEALLPKSMPKSLIVVGSGAIGIEFASFYRMLGAEVTVVEVQERILPVEDVEISTLAHKQFEAQGMQILTSSTVQALQVDKAGVTATVEDGGGNTQELKAEKVIMAVGVVGNIENLGLAGTQVQVERGQIVVDEYCQTDEPGVYAIGDVAGAPWLAHKASHEAVLCIEHIAGNHAHPLKRNNIPGCTYCYPQIASVGLTEAAAKEAGHEVKVGRFPFLANGKAIAMGDTNGLMKTVFDAKTGELLGAHLVGPEVTEMIQGFVIGKTMEATEADFMHTIFPHPTLSEMMHETVLDAYGQALHI